MITRKALHAGSWYSDSGTRMHRYRCNVIPGAQFMLSICTMTGPILDSELTGWLRDASVSHAPARAIIAPYPFSNRLTRY